MQNLITNKARGDYIKSVFILILTPCILCACNVVSSMSTSTQSHQLYERDISDGIHDITPVRGEREPLTIYREGTQYQCTSCHSELIERRRQKALEGEHNNITFEHGRNVLCLNCHNQVDPDTFVDNMRTSISATEPSRLCGKCHESNYDEWRLGTHGRMNGYWDAEYGEPKRLDCIQCHDPHAPQFKAMAPEAPPTLSRFVITTNEGKPNDGH